MDQVYEKLTFSLCWSKCMIRFTLQEDGSKDKDCGCFDEVSVGLMIFFRGYHSQF